MFNIINGHNNTSKIKISSFNGDCPQSNTMKEKNSLYISLALSQCIISFTLLLMKSKPLYNAYKILETSLACRPLFSKEIPKLKSDFLASKQANRMNTFLA